MKSKIYSLLEDIRQLREELDNLEQKTNQPRSRSFCL